MLQKSGRLVLWEAMFILELHSAETQDSLMSGCITPQILSYTVKKYPEGFSFERLY